MHISPKSGGHITEIADEADAITLQERIRTQRLEAYKSCPPDLAEHANAESVLRSEYAGRILLELLQNAHDALASEKIGSKGVGFKAVLNICEQPRIHSGHLHCGFDRQRSQELLQAQGDDHIRDLIRDGENVPLLRFPFDLSREDEPPSVRDLIEKYDTVIVLPFIDPHARERFFLDWRKSANDTRLLLFLKDLHHVTWEDRDNTDISTRVWHRRAQNGHVEICDGINEDVAERWRLYQSKRASVAICLNDSGLPARMGHSSIRVFFETDEQSPLPLLIHAEFPLKEGRNNVLTEDENSRESVRQVAQEVADRVREALAEIPDAGLLLDLLELRTEPKQMGKLESKLWGALKDELSGLQIPKTNGVRLDQVRLRPEDENSKWWFNCGLWNDFKDILSDHSATQFLRLPLLPPGVDTDEREKTILHFNPEARLVVDEFQGLPLLPVDGSSQLFPAAQSNVFFPPQNPTPLTPPDVDVHFLDSDFVNLIDNHQRKENLRKLLGELLSISKFEPISLIRKAILPLLDKLECEQPDGLLDFLCSVVQPELKDDDLIFDWRDPIRRSFAVRVMVPTGHGGRLPATKVYAGSDWTGNDFLDRAYSDCPDRGFLKPPPTDEEEKLCWERFYKWIGVGWCPKVLPLVCFTDRRETKEGPQGRRGYFPLEDEPGRWSAYCKTIDVSFNYQPRMRQNWTLDGGESILAQKDAVSIVSNNWKNYEPYKETVGYKSSNRQQDYDNQKWRSRSYLIWLFQTNGWIPVKRVSEKKKPEDVFTRSEIVREIGGWAYEVEGDVDEDFLKTIGVRSGWKDINGTDWKRWLGRAASLPKEKANQSHKENVRSLYFAALQHWEYDYDSYQGPLWGVKRNQDNTEDWRLRDKRDGIYFVDRPDLAELRIPELYVFPVELNRRGGTAKSRFGLRLLSDYLSGQPVEPIDMADLTKIVQERTKSRLDVINAYLKVKSDNNSFYFEPDNIPEMRVVEKLKVNFKIDGKNIDHDLICDVYHARDNDGHWTLRLSRELFTGERKKPGHIVWEHVASALVYMNDLSLDEQSCLKDLLSYEDMDLERKLLQLGVTKETIANIKPPLSDHPPHDDDGGKALEPPRKLKVPKKFVDLTKSIIAPLVKVGMNGDGSGGLGGKTSGRTRSTSSAQPGLEAQEWLRAKLRGHFKDTGWSVSDSPVRDKERRETDIELNHAQHGTWHVEVKQCEGKVIYWSEKEVEKAQKNLGRYLMVILIRNGKDDFKEYWIVNPLDKLKTLPRTGVWEWRGREDNVLLQEQSGPWTVPDPRAERPAAGFSFKIDVNDDWIKRCGVGFEKLSVFGLTSDKQ